MKSKLVAFVAVVLCGCSAYGSLNTPSGKPEITTSLSREAAITRVQNWLLGQELKYYTSGDTLVVGRSDETSKAQKPHKYFSFQSLSSTSTKVYLKEYWYKEKEDRPIEFINQGSLEEHQRILQQIFKG